MDEADSTVRGVCKADRCSAGRRGFRRAWTGQGARLVPTIFEVVGQGDLDGIFICCGKNGDDVEILRKIVRAIRRFPKQRKPFVCHLSTVSVAFVRAATKFFSNLGIQYCNYPLTGGPVGAEKGNLLILQSLCFVV